MDQSSPILNLLFQPMDLILSFSEVESLRTTARTLLKVPELASLPLTVACVSTPPLS